MKMRVPGVAALALLLVACTGEERTPSSVPASASAAASATASAIGAAPSPSPTAGELAFAVETYPVPSGSHPHDVAPAADGGVWYTAQNLGRLGWLDPETGAIREVALGAGSAPHGVIVGPDDAAWITDGGLNAIVRVDSQSLEVQRYPLPSSVPDANLNTAAFDADGILWFTGQAGWYGSLDPSDGTVRAFSAPRGQGPYGIAATPRGEIYFSSLTGSYLGMVDRSSGEVTVIDPPTAGAGLRRVWADSLGRLWVSQWFAGQVAVYDPADGSWQEWPLPGAGAQAYSVYVDELDGVWLTDFTTDAIVRFDPQAETFVSFPAEQPPSAVRQMLGRAGEVWGAESAADRLIVVRYGR